MREKIICNYSIQVELFPDEVGTFQTDLEGLAKSWLGKDIQISDPSTQEIAKPIPVHPLVTSLKRDLQWALDNMNDHTNSWALKCMMNNVRLQYGIERPESV